MLVVMEIDLLSSDYGSSSCTQSQNHISYYGILVLFNDYRVLLMCFHLGIMVQFLVFFFLQVRSKLTSLDNIVPPTHGFMISSTAMKNVWLSMEHQAILWCNQLVVQVSRFILVKSIYLVLLYVVLIIYILIQVSHTLLSLIDSRTGQPLPDTQKRLAVFARMLRSGISHNFDWMMQLPSCKRLLNIPVQNTKDVTGIICCCF